MTEKKEPKKCTICGAKTLIEHGNRLFEISKITGKLKYKTHQYNGPGSEVWDR